MLWITAALISAQAQQQPEKQGREKLLEKKLNYLREKLMLNDREFVVFEQEFKSFETQRWKLFRQKKQILQTLRGNKTANLSDKEIADKLKHLRKLERSLFELKDKHFERIQNILPPRKALQYWKYSLQFNKMLLKKRKTHRRKTGEKSDGHR